MRLALIFISAVIFLSFISAQEEAPFTDEACRRFNCLCIEKDRTMNFLAACPNTNANRCYANAECKIQSETGKCGWSMDETLKRCLEAARPIRLDTREDDETTDMAPRCRPTGCSGTLCSDYNVDTPCEYKPEHGCYKYAVCRRDQNTGVCGWDFTSRFNVCMMEIARATLITDNTTLITERS